MLLQDSFVFINDIHDRAPPSTSKRICLAPSDESSTPKTKDGTVAAADGMLWQRCMNIVNAGRDCDQALAA